GTIGEDAALFLGGLVIGAFQHAVVRRSETPPEARPPFFMIIDEVGSFATPPLLELVAEARKFGAGLVIATQSLAALDRSVRASPLGFGRAVRGRGAARAPSRTAHRPRRDAAASLSRGCARRDPHERGRDQRRRRGLDQGRGARRRCA